MSEVTEITEKEVFFSDLDATALENWIIGSSCKVQLADGSEVLVSAESLPEIYKKDPHAIKTPINFLRGQKSVEEINKAREKEGYMNGMVMGLFGAQSFIEFLKMGVKTSIKLDPVDENGEIKDIRIKLLKEGEAFDPESYNDLFSLSPEYEEVLNSPELMDGYAVCTFKEE